MIKHKNPARFVIFVLMMAFTLSQASSSISIFKKNDFLVEQLNESSSTESDINLKSILKIQNFICHLFQMADNLSGVNQKINKKLWAYHNINSPHGFHLPVYLDNSALLI